MEIVERLRIVHVQVGFSRNAIERSNVLQSFSVSRIENGYSASGLETLERMVSVEKRYESSFSCFVRVGWSKRAGSI